MFPNHVSSKHLPDVSFRAALSITQELLKFLADAPWPPDHDLTIDELDGLGAVIRMLDTNPLISRVRNDS